MNFQPLKDFLDNCGETLALLARELARKIENELEYPGQIKINVIRETKAVEYAK